MRQVGIPNDAILLPQRLGYQVIANGCSIQRLPRPGRSLTGKKKVLRHTVFPKKARGHSMCSTMVGGGRRLAVGGGWWWLAAVGGC